MVGKINLCPPYEDIFENFIDVMDIFEMVGKIICPPIKKWLNFIEDSLYGDMNEVDYQETALKSIIAAIPKHTIGPAFLSEKSMAYK